MTISTTQADAVRRRLEQKSRRLPETLRGKMDVVRQNYDTIIAMQKKGYLLDYIAREIGDAGGFTITVNTLKNYLHRIRAERGLETHPRPPPPAGTKAGRGAKAVAEGRALAPAGSNDQQGSIKLAKDEASSGRFEIPEDRTDI